MIGKRGLLQVDHGHEIYWEDWGNPNSETVILHLHGGPGSSFSSSHKRIYDPSIHRVIFHDQRGCGKSQSQKGRLIANNTQSLIKDIEALRLTLNLGKVVLSGGSWGSTLVLLYAQAYPKHVLKLLLWSTWLARSNEEWAANEGFRSFYRPEEWKEFINNVPSDLRNSSFAVQEYFFKKVMNEDLETAFFFANQFDKWSQALNGSCDYGDKEESYEKRELVESMRVFLHFATNNCFIEENAILENLDRIRLIPCDIVHGRFDLNTAPFISYDLAQAYGENAKLHWVNSGHLRSDPKMLKKLQELALQLCH